MSMKIGRRGFLKAAGAAATGPVVISAFSDRDGDPVVGEFQDLGIPVYETPEQAVSAMAALIRAGTD